MSGSVVLWGEASFISELSRLPMSPQIWYPTYDHIATVWFRTTEVRIVIHAGGTCFRGHQEAVYSTNASRGLSMICPVFNGECNMCVLFMIKFSVVNFTIRVLRFASSVQEKWVHVPTSSKNRLERQIKRCNVPREEAYLIWLPVTLWPGSNSGRRYALFRVTAPFWFCAAFPTVTAYVVVRCVWRRDQVYTYVCMCAFDATERSRWDDNFALIPFVQFMPPSISPLRQHGGSDGISWFRKCICVRVCILFVASSQALNSCCGSQFRWCGYIPGCRIFRNACLVLKVIKIVSG